MKNLVFLLEEPSAREMLKGVVPRIISDEIVVEYIVFEGKRDLEKKIGRKIKYWLKPKSCFLIMVDQDRSDCSTLKEKILSSLQESGKDEVSLVRIACRELESFYLGDLESVETALKLKGLSANQNKAKYRNPDDIDRPSLELKILTRGIYQKVRCSRMIGPGLKVDGSNRSHSFNTLLAGIEKLASY